MEGKPSGVSRRFTEGKGRTGRKRSSLYIQVSWVYKRRSDESIQSMTGELGNEHANLREISVNVFAGREFPEALER